MALTAAPTRTMSARARNVMPCSVIPATTRTDHLMPRSGDVVRTPSGDATACPVTDGNPNPPTRWCCDRKPSDR